MKTLGSRWQKINFLASSLSRLNAHTGSYVKPIQAPETLAIAGSLFKPIQAPKKSAIVGSHFKPIKAPETLAIPGSELKTIQAQKTSAIAGSTCVATTGFEGVLSHLSSPFFHN